ETSRSGVEIQTFVELAKLARAGDLFDDVAAPHGEIASAGTILRFENGDRVILFVQLVRGGESRDSGAEDQDFAAVAGRKFGNSGECGGNANESHRHHRFIRRRGAAGAADRLDKSTTCPRGLG